MPSWIQAYRKVELPAATPSVRVDIAPTNEKGLLPLYSASDGERNVAFAAKSAATAAAVTLEKRSLGQQLEHLAHINSTTNN